MNYLWPKAAFPRAEGPKIFVFEITTRVLDGLHLWAPDDKEFVSLMWGVIGRALAKHPTVELYGVHILSNHYGILAGFEDQATLEQFKRHLNSCLARETNHCRDRSGPVVGRRARSILIDSGDKLLERLKYCLGNGTAENLVSRPDLWPGVHCAKALLEGTTPKGKWINRGPHFKAKRRAKSGKTVKLADFTHMYDIVLSKIPTLLHLTDIEYRGQIRSLCDQIVVERRKKHAGKAALGVKILTKVDAWKQRTPFKLRRPGKSSAQRIGKKKKTAAPKIHVSSPDRRGAFDEAYKQFVDAMRAERCRLAEAFDNVVAGICEPYHLAHLHPAPVT